MGGKIRTRTVDISSEHYKVARDYMIRLEPEDLEDGNSLNMLAKVASVQPGELRRLLSPLVGVPVPT